MCLYTHEFFFSCSKKKITGSLIKIGCPSLRQSYNINVQDSTIFSTNGCRYETNEVLLYCFRYLNFQNKFAAARFYSCFK